MEYDVTHFINRFTQGRNTVETFTNGCCYWFAMVLYLRFIKNGASIMYDPVANHFGTMVDGRVYDITGDVTDGFSWIKWADADEEISKERVTRDCIMF